MRSARIGARLGCHADSWRLVRASIAKGSVQDIASDHLADLVLAIQKDRRKAQCAASRRLRTCRS